MSGDESRNNNEMLDGLSFGNSFGNSYAHDADPISDPVVAPPASAPPPPPSSSPKNLGEYSSSYQGRAAPQPSIENYGTTEPSRASNFLFNPNTGFSNASGATGRLALREIVLYMRILNLSLCSITILIEFFSWFGDIVQLKSSQFFLGVYLAFFSTLLCSYELHTPRVENVLKSEFGFIYSPYGRAFTLIIMGGIALGQKNVFETILGLIMVINGIYTGYLPCAYPDYDKIHQIAATDDLVGRAQDGVSKYAWANPNRAAGVLGGAGSTTSTSSSNGSGETQRLV